MVFLVVAMVLREASTLMRISSIIICILYSVLEYIIEIIFCIIIVNICDPLRENQPYAIKIDFEIRAL